VHPPVRSAEHPPDGCRRGAVRALVARLPLAARLAARHGLRDELHDRHELREHQPVQRREYAQRAARAEALRPRLRRRGPRPPGPWLGARGRGTARVAWRSAVARRSGLPAAATARPSAGRLGAPPRGRAAWPAA